MTEISIFSNKELTMTSREIAELVESRHDSVKRTVERLIESGVIQSPPMVKFKNINNVEGQEYLIRKRSTYIVCAQIAPQCIGGLVDRWGKTEATLRELLDALTAFGLPDDLPDDLFIYAIREQETGHIKLGISRDPRARVAQLQTGNSCKLELVAVRPAANRFADEKAIHADAEAYRLRGEWFSAAALEVLQ